VGVLRRDPTAMLPFAGYDMADAIPVLGAVASNAMPCRDSSDKGGWTVDEYRILALDGGGVRGAYTSKLIERLNDATGFLQRTDLVAGTSTGGIIALALAAGKEPKDVTALYRDKDGAIFSTPFWRRLQEGVVISKYPADGLRVALTSVLGSLKLEDLKAHTVLVPAFDLDSEAIDEPRSWKAKFFHNLPNEDSDGQEVAVEVGLRTAAAPTYFPTSDNYIDGGVVANNPAMAALALAINADMTKGAGKSLSQVRMLSVGTGQNCKWVVGDHDWGAVEWGKKLIELLIEGTMGVASYQCKAILGQHFKRLDPVLPEEVDLDDDGCVEKLVTWAGKERLDDTIEWIRSEFLGS
jgi:patatin-like phospholipase/acyl hydrolase